MVKKAIIIVAEFIILLSVFILLSYYGATAIDKTTSANVRQSLTILQEEGDYPHKFGKFIFKKDNFTDAIMVGAIACTDPDSLAVSALASPVYYKADTDTASVADAIIRQIDSGVKDGITYYGRYWHGYRPILRAAHAFLSLDGIRIANYIILYSLFSAVLWLIRRRISLTVSLFYAISLLAVAFPIVPDTMQFSSCFYISFIASICILSRQNISPFHISCIMLAAGGFTSFIDFLTTPIITLGLPLGLALLRTDDAKLRWRILLSGSLCWCSGYFGLWLSKWILASAFTPYNIIADAIEAVKFRSGSVLLTDENGNIDKNMQLMIYLHRAITLLFALAAITVACLRKQPGFNKALPFAVIAFLPLLWMTLVYNHSLHHLWFVWRIFSVSIFCGLIFFYSLLKKQSPQKPCAGLQ